MLILKYAILAGLIKLSLGDRHSMILRPDGSAWSTSAFLNNKGSSRAVRKGFAQVIACGATAVAAGPDYSIVLKQGGYVWAMGENSNGQLGTGTRTNKETFIFVRMITGAKAVAAGHQHALILTHEGRVWVAGWNKYGQLGDGSTTDHNRFFQVINNGRKPVAVAAGEAHSIVLRRDGTVWATGRNNNGQLGDGSTVHRSSFVKVIPSGAADVAAGSSHSIVLTQDGSIWTTGLNEFGQLGDGSTTDRASYVLVIPDGVKAGAAGSLHSMVLKQDGSVWATGHNLYGQLGDGSTTSRNIFVHVMLDGAIAVAAGGFHSMILKQDGSIWATGSNQDGQFGDGSTTSKTSFVKIEPFGDGAGHDMTQHAQLHNHSFL